MDQEILRPYTGPLAVDMELYEELYGETRPSIGFSSSRFADYYAYDAETVFVEFDNRLRLGPSLINDSLELGLLPCKSSRELMGFTTYSFKYVYSLRTLLSQEAIKNTFIDNSYTALVEEKFRRV